MAKEISKSSLTSYLETIICVLSTPTKVYSKLKLETSELLSYVIVSGLFYAIIANILKTLAPFPLLILSPLSAIPHVFLLSVFIYLIFKKLYKADTNFKTCFKISCYTLIALLPLTAIVFAKNTDSLLILSLKFFPFIYYLILTHKAVSINFKNLSKKAIIQGNVLASLTSLFASTIVFTINMNILNFITEFIFHYQYIWKFNYY